MVSLSIRKAGSLTGVNVHTEAVEVRDPTHFVILLDTSDSMNEEGKLANVKRCISLLLQVMNNTDYLSLITFATESKIHLKRVLADSMNKSQIDSTIQNLKTEGWTNLSAGLSNLAKVLQGETLKTGVILLTDGHANTGMRDTEGLITMIEGLRARHTTMSISSIAYGTDHNANLLLRTAQVGGSSSYSIVKNLEDAATAIGDCAGGFMSLLAQNVDVHFPLGTTIRSSFPVHESTASVFIRLGDVYSGTDTLILVDFPENGNTKVTLTGTRCQPFENIFVEQEVVQESVERDKELELTDIRLQVSSLFKDLRTNSDSSTIRRNVSLLRQRLADEFLGGPVCDMLKSELTSIENVLNGAHVHHTTLLQHENFTGLGRGLTTSITSESAYTTPRLTLGRGSLAPPNNLIRQNAIGITESDDPVTFTSPFQSQAQRLVASTLRSMSQQPDA